MAYKILIVDDDQGLTRALAVRLRLARYEVWVANDAHAATVLVQRHRPDALILDIDMPHFSGLEFHECLQLAGRTRRIPVVYLSGHDDDAYRRMAFEQGPPGLRAQAVRVRISDPGAGRADRRAGGVDHAVRAAGGRGDQESRWGGCCSALRSMRARALPSYGLLTK